ncbi:unnamed protein product, partial [Nesidiocoris tenuis]
MNNSSSISIEKLRGRENYGSWKIAMRAALRLEKVWTNVVEFKSDVDPSTVDCEKDEQALSRITLAIDKVNYSHIAKASTAREAWDSLAAAFEDSGLSRRVALLRSLVDARLELFPSAEEYCNEVLTLAQKLNDLKFVVDDEWVGTLLLAGLPEEYRPMIMGLENSGIKISGDNVKVRILQDVKPSTDVDSALLAVRRKRKPHRPRQEQQRRSYSDGRPTPPKPKHKPNRPPPPAFLSCFATSLSDDRNAWYLDSGASSHITHSSNLLSDVRPCSETAVTVADRSTMDVAGIGDTTIRSSLSRTSNIDVEVHDVLHVPEAAANLLSISKIVRRGNTVEIGGDGAKIRDPTRRIIGTARLENGLYRLNTADDAFRSPANRSPSERSPASALLTVENADLWHRRTGHLNINGLQHLQACSTGIGCLENPKETCEVCLQGKQSRPPFHRSQKRRENLLDLVHVDLCGPMETMSIGGARYFLTLVDDHSRHVFVYILKEKSQVKKYLADFKALVECQTGRKIKAIRSDNGTEFCNSAVSQLFTQAGIIHQRTMNYTPQQNSRVERAQRTLVEKARSMLADAKLGKEFWAEAIVTACYLINRSPSRALGERTPYEVWHGEKPDLSHLRVFGCSAWAHIPKQRRKKLDPKSERLIFIGYPEDRRGYRLLDPVTKRVTNSRDVHFVEISDNPESCSPSLPVPLTPVVPSARKPSLPVPLTPVVPSARKPSPPVPLTPVVPSARNKNVEYVPTPFSSSSASSGKDQLTSSAPSSPNPEDVPLPLTDDSGEFEGFDMDESTLSNFENVDLRRSSRLWKKKFGNLEHTSYLVHQSCDEEEPATYKEAIGGDNAAKWDRAMEEERNSLVKNNTYEVVDLPPGKKTLSMKWVYKIKETEGDRRYKARLVVRGCAQVPGLDFQETYSPVVKYSSLRFLMSMAAVKDWDIDHLDVKTAYLYGDLNEEIYVRPPANFSEPDGQVWRLKKAVYGLKQAGRCWNEKITEVLAQMKFHRSKSDPCIFVRNTESAIVIVALWVDDVIVFSDNAGEKSKVKSSLAHHFEMKDLGPIHRCLGMNVTRDRARRQLSIDQTHYIEQVLKRFSMENCKPVSTPMESDVKGLAMEQKDVQPYNEAVPYQEAIGCLLYISQITRPDIIFAVNTLSRFNRNFQLQHWSAVKRIMRYLKGTMYRKLAYSPSEETRNLTAYSDSDWGGVLTDRYSVSGLCVRLNNGLISWASRRQQTIALSSVEAEYMALSSCVQEVIWMRAMMQEVLYAIEGPTRIFCDNQGAIHLSHNEVVSRKSKHIELRYHFLKEHLKRGEILILYLPSEQMLADPLTKSLPRPKFAELVESF